MFIGILLTKVKSNLGGNPSRHEDNKVKSKKHHKEICCTKFAPVCYFVGVGGNNRQSVIVPSNAVEQTAQIKGTLNFK